MKPDRAVLRAVAEAGAEWNRQHPAGWMDVKVSPTELIAVLDELDALRKERDMAREEIERLVEAHRVKVADLYTQRADWMMASASHHSTATLVERDRNRLAGIVAAVEADRDTALARAESYRDGVRALMAGVRLRLGGPPQDGPLAAAYARGVGLVGEEG